MRFFDLRTPFFRPLWRRVAVVVLALGWALVEISGGNVFWAILFGAMGAYAAYEFFVIYDPVAYTDAADRSGAERSADTQSQAEATRKDDP